MNRLFFLFTLLFFSVNLALAQDFDDEFNDEDFAAFENEFVDEKNTIYDPFEPVNRKIFIFNDYADLYLVAPVARAYRDYVPGFARKSVRNFTTNVTLPISTLNSFAQGKLDNALATFSTFLINSTVGLLGIFDVAGSKKISYNLEDFGQTLAHYGLGAGPYLVLPLLGPSNLRDLTGRVTDNVVDVTGFDAFDLNHGDVDDDWLVLNAAVGLIDRREVLLDIVDGAREDSMDLYATMRSYYNQNRNSAINK